MTMKLSWVTVVLSVFAYVFSVSLLLLPLIRREKSKLKLMRFFDWLIDIPRFGRAMSVSPSATRCGWPGTIKVMPLWTTFTRHCRASWKLSTALRHLCAPNCRARHPCMPRRCDILLIHWRSTQGHSCTIVASLKMSRPVFLSWKAESMSVTGRRASASEMPPALFLMVALCNRADHYIFALWLLSFYLFLFPRLISAAGDWMSTILPHMVWP